MTININVNEMTHLPALSGYNHNLYSYGNDGVKLLQKCDEESNTYDYYLLQDDAKVFLGSASHNEEEIDLMYRYT